MGALGEALGELQRKGFLRSFASLKPLRTGVVLSISSLVSQGRCPEMPRLCAFSCPTELDQLSAPAR